MTLGYRTILRTDASKEAASTIAAAVSDWLWKEKGFRAIPTGEASATNARGDRVHASESIVGGGMRWVLSEAWDAPDAYTDTTTSRIARTTISLLVDEDLTLWIDVEPPTLIVEGREVSQRTPVPSLISELLDLLPFRDGTTDLLNEPALVTSGHIGEVMDAILDDERQGLIYVTGVGSDVDAQSWREMVVPLVNQVLGMGRAYVLDERALAELRTHAVDIDIPGAFGLNIYRPVVDGELEIVGISNAAMILEDEAALRRTLRADALHWVNSAPLPIELLASDAALRREHALAAFSPSERNVAALLAQLDDAEAVTLEALDDLASIGGDLAVAHQELQDYRIQASLDSDALRSERIRSETLNAELAHLRRELLNKGGAASAYSYRSDVPAAAPSTFVELLDRLDELGGVEFYGDREVTLELDEQSALGAPIVARTWDALVTFDSYVRARNSNQYDGSLRNYVQNADHGFPMRISVAKWHESVTVRSDRKMREERVVSVPTSISENGELMLVAHVPLATRRANSPRLYFHDTYSAAGKVIVGHIGGHLTNTLTS